MNLGAQTILKIRNQRQQAIGKGAGVPVAAFVPPMPLPASPVIPADIPVVEVAGVPVVQVMDADLEDDEEEAVADAAAMDVIAPAPNQAI